MFYGLNFAIGGIAAGFFGGLTDRIGIEGVYQICSFIPIAGCLAVFLPRLEGRR
jgi:FSR family fosmidomycin resistance protein-like MFS transporter